MEVDPHAPVVLSVRRTLDASASTAWKVLSDVEGWPQWVPAVRRASLDGALLIGAGFRCTVRGRSLRGTLREVEKPRRIAWTARSLGMQLVHVWEIEDHGDGTCDCRTAKSLSGWWVRPLAGPVLARAQTFLEDWVEALGRRVRSEVPCD